MPLKKRLEATICGAICLLIGGGASTLLHECGHLVAARSLGLQATLGGLTLTTGSVFISGNMTATETALVAVAGSIGLIVIGWILTGAQSQYVRMIGIMFLCRAWIDVLPICDTDGAWIASSAGYAVAATIVIAEVLICGGRILSVLDSDKVQRHKSSA